MAVFEKTLKNQKYGSIIPQQTFSKALDRGVKIKETPEEYAGIQRRRMERLGIDTLF